MTQAAHEFGIEKSKAFNDLFLHKLRHDLLNTVRPVVEIPKWIEEDILEEGYTVPDSLRENLDMLGIHSTRLLRMIEDLLAFAHIDRHHETAPVSLGAIISKMIEDAIPVEFQLITDLEHDTLPVPKPDAITLLEALLSNSIKHHDRGSGKIRVTCKKVGSATHLTVFDDGPGIDPKYVDRIFDPLTTLVSRDQVEGSGMGLAMVRQIASANGGHVKAIASAKMRGTCIVVWFP